MNNDQPDELSKAIEHADAMFTMKEEQQERARLTFNPHFVKQLLSAAKQLRQVEKERDELKFLLENANEANNLISQERDQLKAALEQSQQDNERCSKAGTTAQAMVYVDLLQKFEESQTALRECARAVKKNH